MILFEKSIFNYMVVPGAKHKYHAISTLSLVIIQITGHKNVILSWYSLSTKMASTPRIVLVTGCSSGLGLSLAVLLAKDSEKRFKVYATMRNLDKKSSLETAGKEVLGETLVVRQLDVCSDESVHKTVQEILHTEGRVDVLGEYGV